MCEGIAVQVQLKEKKNTKLPSAPRHAQSKYRNSLKLIQTIYVMVQWMGRWQCRLYAVRTEARFEACSSPAAYPAGTHSCTQGQEHKHRPLPLPEPLVKAYTKTKVSRCAMGQT